MTWLVRAHGAVAKLLERADATFPLAECFPVLPSSIICLRSVSKFVLQIVPPVLASVISAYLLSAYQFGAKPAPEARGMIGQELSPAGVAMDVIAAGHEAARVPAPTKPTFEPRLPVAADDTQASARVPPPRIVRAARELAVTKPASVNVAAAEKVEPLPAPPSIAAAAPAQPVAEPEQTRVLGVPVPRLVTRTGEKVAGVASAMRPSRLLSATWEFGKQAAGTVASAAGAIVPESRR
jgi:hypothetical protein